MKTVNLLLSFISVLTIPAYSQDSIVPRYEDSIPRRVAEINDNRERADDFYRKIRAFAEPSTLSGWYTDYTFNTVDSLQKKPYILNAEVQTPFALGGKRWIIRENFLWSLHVTTHFKIKIFDNDTMHGDSSLPVRTPSYMAGLAVFASTKRFWPEEDSEPHHYLFIRGYHHSNGQDGPELVNGSINYYNGNFGEDVVLEGGLGGYWTDSGLNENKSTYKLIKNIKNIRGKERTKKSFRERSAKKYFNYFRAGYEMHPKDWSNSTFLRYHMYGRHRLNLNYGRISTPWVRDVIYNKETDSYYTDEEFRNKETWRITANMTYIMDTNYNRGDLNNLYNVSMADWRRVNVSLTVYKTFPVNADVSAFIQTNYFGSDPYNIYFNQSMFQVRGGLAFGFSNNSFNREKRGELEKVQTKL